MKKLLLLLTILLALSCEKPSDDRDVVGVTIPGGTTDSVDPDLEIVGGLDSYTGTLSGAYNLQGTYTYTAGTITLGSNYSNSAPAPYLYLSNNSRSIIGGVKVSSSELPDGAGTYAVDADIFNKYQYIIIWCQPFSAYIGGDNIY